MFIALIKLMRSGSGAQSGLFSDHLLGGRTRGILRTLHPPFNLGLGRV